MGCIKVFLLGIVFVFVSSKESFPSAQNIFNQLVLTKGSLESRFGVRSVECFPFKKNIGFTEDQIPLIKNCLAGVRLLFSAFEQTHDLKIRTVGISTRFLRTGGFHTILIPWDASLQETVSFLENKISNEPSFFKGNTSRAYIYFSFSHNHDKIFSRIFGNFRSSNNLLVTNA